mmetsp:Transcript_38581/g.110857  ORF Transcript_38581/g.110857 Transcript_38581/m.110857 type:complete len:352 (+) Transcript_38581:679-1734(+)
MPIAATSCNSPTEPYGSKPKLWKWNWPLTVMMTEPEKASKNAEAQSLRKRLWPKIRRNGSRIALKRSTGGKVAVGTKLSVPFRVRPRRASKFFGLISRNMLFLRAMPSSESNLEPTSTEQRTIKYSMHNASWYANILCQLVRNHLNTKKISTGRPFKMTFNMFTPANTAPVATSRSWYPVTSFANANGTLAAVPTEPTTFKHIIAQRPCSVGPKTMTTHTGMKLPKPKMAAASRRSILSLRRPKGPPATEAMTLMAMPKVEFITAMRWPQIVPARTEMMNVSATAAADCCKPDATTTLHNSRFRQSKLHAAVKGPLPPPWPSESLLLASLLSVSAALVGDIAARRWRPEAA